MTKLKLYDRVRITEGYKGPDRELVGEIHTVKRIQEGFLYPVETIRDDGVPFLFEYDEVELVGEE